MKTGQDEHKVTSLIHESKKVIRDKKIANDCVGYKLLTTKPWFHPSETFSEQSHKFEGSPESDTIVSNVFCSSTI